MPENKQESGSAGAPAGTIPQGSGNPTDWNAVHVSAEQAAQMNALADGLLAAAQAVKLLITEEQRRELSGMGPANQDFVRKFLEYLKKFPGFAGELVSEARLFADMAELEFLDPLVKELEAVLLILRDRRAVAENELVQATLMGYHFNQLKAKQGDPIAQDIHADLSQRFHGRPKKHGEKEQRISPAG